MEGNQIETKEQPKQDPLGRIATALEDSAKTDDEKIIANMNKNALEIKRAELLEFFHTQKKRGVGVKIYSHEEFDRIPLEIRNIDKAAAVFRAFPVVMSSSEEMPREYTEEFLKEMGVLKKDQDIYQFFQESTTWPIYDVRENYNLSTPNGKKAPPSEPVKIADFDNSSPYSPYPQSRWLAGIPTNIPGVTMILRHGKSPSVYLSMTQDAF